VLNRRPLLIALTLLCGIGCTHANALEATSQYIRERLQTNPTVVQTSATAVVQFYEQRNFEPIWTDPARLDHLVSALESTIDDGLNPEDYSLSRLKQERALATDTRKESAVLRANLDLLATEAYLRALHHLLHGKVDPASLDAEWNFQSNSANPLEAPLVASEAISNGKIAELFAQARPRHPLYARLRAALLQLRTLESNGGWPLIPDGPTLKPGVSDARVLLLRARLRAADDLPNDAIGSDLYDEPLTAAVKRFQREQYLQADGAVGPATLAALNISTVARIDQLRVNLERGRWLLHDVPETFVLVDVAGYKVSYYKNGERIWRSRVQVGKPYRSTPIFKSKINYITLNPTWTVPPTILRNDILPKVRTDPGYLARNNIKVLNKNGEIIAPTQVDWRNPGGITLRQDAGSESALGRAAIRFPNSYAVYLHDTPHQELFDQNQRAFSSGCIRVEKALDLVKLLLADTSAWNSAAIDATLATGKTRNVNLAQPIPIMLAYWTVDIGDDGHIAFKLDIYNRDTKLLNALDKPS
jgi:L,D-transpeptidase YcbB